MAITIDQFKGNIAKYFHLSETEDVSISVDGKVVATLTNPNRNRIQIAKSLIGSLKDSSFTLEDAKRKRLSRI